MNNFRLIAVPLLILLLATILISCGKIGTAVIMWPPENSQWQPGDIVTVKDESLLRNTYIVRIPNQRRMMEELDKWRLNLFKREGDAIQFANSMDEWRNIYAECLYQGLPMREEPSNLAPQIYRFRERDIMKVLSREPGPVPVGNLEGYWYKVLAEGGVEGYVFDYHLSVYRLEGNSITVLNVRESGNPALDNLMESAWRPQYFGEMLQQQRIDLTIFSSDYGFFINKDEQTLSINLPNQVLKERWTEIVSAGHNRYDFLGTSFRITINSTNFISVQYNVSGNEYFEAFVRLYAPVPTIISGEIQRRKDTLANLTQKGNIYGSQTYGELILQDTGRFSWIRKSPLISRGILSANAGNTGQIDHNIFLDNAIAASWDGAIRLRFDNGEAISFLYIIESDGLRMLNVPDNSIVNNIVITDTWFNPVRIYFLLGQ